MNPTPICAAARRGKTNQISIDQRPAVVEKHSPIGNNHGGVLVSLAG
ncbi:MAG: hypothetical protein QGG39_00030 [Candidatus Poribacteria bacterium]|nr:hypothetical protein [Candidatus Poribacteria bacterium]